jgi:hypothetical protein
LTHWIPHFVHMPEKIQYFLLVHFMKKQEMFKPIELLF